MRRFSPGLLAALLTIVLPACPSNGSSRACLDEHDCPGLVRCLGGLCTPECEQDSECVEKGLGLHCALGGCVDVEFEGPFHVAPGDHQQVAEGAEVELDGSASRYIGDGTLTVRWSQVSGTPVTLSAPDQLETRFTAPRVVKPDELVFRLELADGEAEAEGETTIEVLDTINENPLVVVKAPVDPQIEGKLVLLDARASSDPNGDPLKFEWPWTQTAGQTVELSDPSPVKGSLAFFRAPQVPSLEEFSWRINVTDTRGGRASADVYVSVRDLETVACTSVADCITAAPCLAVRCEGGVCLSSTLKRCCAGGRCFDDENPCTLERCDEDMGCIRELLAGCCRLAADCPDPGECLEAMCEADGTCTSRWIDGCCRRDADCPTPDPCSVPVCVAGTCESEAIPLCCTGDASCDDGHPCTADRCDSILKLCRHDPVPGCCTEDKDCRDASACTADTCNESRQTCQHTPVQGCCGQGDDCEDGNPCTIDGCDVTTGTCSYERILGCCLSDAECSASGPCSDGVCVDNSCLDLPIPECCDAGSGGAGSACDDGDPCTVDVCDEGASRCRHARRADCCKSSAGCDDGDPCTRDVCRTEQGRCAFLPVLGCCIEDADCDDQNPCTEDTCVEGRCRRAAVPDCCMSNDACDDGDPCTADRCLAIPPECEHAPIVGCCDEDSDCVQPGDPCRSARCHLAEGRCVDDRDPDCCAGDGVCEPAGRCVIRTCVSGRCVPPEDPPPDPPEWGLPACCFEDVDCEDGNTCTEDTCRRGRCRHDMVIGCCRRDDDCPRTQACQDTFCSGNPGVCKSVDVPNCCTNNGDCDDLNPCTEDRCRQGRCEHRDVAGCCLVDQDCVISRPCDAFVCSANTCLPLAVAGCCNTDADCDDGDECTEDRCDSRKRQCVHAHLSGCCAGDADCEDGDHCTVDSCVGSACRHEPSSVSCCVSNGDCADADPCTLDLCVPGLAGTGASDGEDGAEAPPAACAQVQVAGCCSGDEGCSGGPCAPGYCDAVERRCRGATLPGCCTTASDCPPADRCAEVDCVEHMCSATPRTACCASDSDCDDQNPCTEDTCGFGGGCNHEPTLLGESCDDGDLQTAADICDASGRCAGFRAWATPLSLGQARLLAVDADTGLVTGGAGGPEASWSMVVLSSDESPAHTVLTGEHGDVAAADGAYMLASAGRVLDLGTSESTEISEISELSEALATIGASPWESLLAAPGPGAGGRRLLAGGQGASLAHCASPGSEEPWACATELLPGSGPIRSLADGPTEEVAAWALEVPEGGLTRIHARARFGVATEPWSTAPPGGCGGVGGNCADAELRDLASAPGEGRGIAVGLRGTVLVWTPTGGWSSLERATIANYGPAPSRTDLRAVTIVGDLHLVAGLEDTCLRGSPGQECRITLRRWWLLPARFDWASGLQWLPALQLFESRCGPALGRPCPDPAERVGPLEVAASDASTWRVAGTTRGEGGLVRGLLLWRR